MCESIRYDLSYFFQWYSANPEHWKPDFKYIVDCVVVEKQKHSQTMIIKCILPNDVIFQDKAYELCRCSKNTDGSWYLKVVLITDMPSTCSQYSRSRHIRPSSSQLRSMHCASRASST